MNAPVNFDKYDVGFDIPAKPGMDEADKGRRAGVGPAV